MLPGGIPILAQGYVIKEIRTYSNNGIRYGPRKFSESSSPEHIFSHSEALEPIIG